MLATTATTFATSALIKVIGDLEQALQSLEGRSDPHAQRLRPIFEESLRRRKRELVGKS